MSCGRDNFGHLPNLVISNLVILNVYALCALLHSLEPFCTLLRSFPFLDPHALFPAHLRSFALIRVFLRPAAFRTTAL